MSGQECCETTDGICSTTGKPCECNDDKNETEVEADEQVLNTESKHQ